MTVKDRLLTGLALVIVVAAVVWSVWGYWVFKEAVLVPATSWIPDWVKSIFSWWSFSPRY